MCGRSSALHFRYLTCLLDRGHITSVLGELKAKKDEVAKQPKKEAVEKATKSKGEEL